MSGHDERIDAYIANAADFAKPILTRIRKIVHRECPDVEETIKWRMPSFQYHGLLCNMAAFKSHCAFGFWKHHLVVGKSEKTEGGMGQFGHLKSVSDLPSDKDFAAYVRKAMQLNEEGVKKPRAVTKRVLVVPKELLAALKKNKKALATFESFSPTNKRDYADWVAEAKTDATRDRRIATAVEWMAEGKTRNWKYMNC